MMLALFMIVTVVLMVLWAPKDPDEKENRRKEMSLYARWLKKRDKENRHE